MPDLPGVLSKILARVRAGFPPSYTDGDTQGVDVNNRGDLEVVQALPPEAELVRMGNTYISIGTAVAPVAALPTTAAHFSLFNGESDGGKSYIISYVGFLTAVSAAAAVTAGPLAYCLNKGRQTNPAGSIAITPCRSDKITYGGKGNTKASVTITNDGWYPIGSSVVDANTANAMLALEYSVFGRFIVAPGGIFSLATLCNAAGSATCQPWILWHEVQLTLP